MHVICPSNCRNFTLLRDFSLGAKSGTFRNMLVRISPVGPCCHLSIVFHQRRWPARRDWKGVVFIDPYGIQSTGSKPLSITLAADVKYVQCYVPVD